jgi:four helix bundle protein
MSDFKRHNFKKLKIWQMGMEIAKQILDLTDTYPSPEKFGLKSQMDRCSISLPSNIAEGSSRTDKSFSHFLDISLGSSFELQTQLLLANHKKYITEEHTNFIEIKIEEFQKATMSFQNTLKK